MDNKIQLPFINGIKFVVKGLVPNPKYNTRHIDDYLYRDQVPSWKQYRPYYAPLQLSDNLYFQFITNYGPVSSRLVNCMGDVVTAVPVSTISNNYYIAPDIAYEAKLPMAAIAEGIYSVQILLGAGPTLMTLESEPISLKSYHEKTKVLEYRCYQNNYGAIFQNGETFEMRTELSFEEPIFGANRTVFDDQKEKTVVLSCFPFRGEKLYGGAELGVPSWVPDRFNWISGCDYILIDGKQYACPEGSKIELSGDRGYSRFGWNIDIREAQTRNGVTIVNNIPLNNRISVMYDIETLSFGDLQNPPFNSGVIILNEQ